MENDASFRTQRRKLPFQAMARYSGHKATRSRDDTTRSSERRQATTDAAPNRDVLKPWTAGKGDGNGPPLPRCAVCIFRVGSRSIDGDAGTRGCSRDLRDRGSDADSIIAGRAEFDIEGAAIGFAVGGNPIVFVDGENVRNFPRRR